MARDTTADWPEGDAGVCCEVTICWGTTTLGVFHLAPPRDFIVGESDNQDRPCDLLVPASVIGRRSIPLVVRRGGSVAVFLPTRAMGTLELPNQPAMDLSAARLLAEPHVEAVGGCLLALPLGARVAFEIGEFAFRAAMIRAGKPLRHGIHPGDLSMIGYFGLSVAAVGGLLATTSFLSPPIGLTDDEGANADQVYLVQQYLQSASEREQERNPSETVVTPIDLTEGGTGTRALAEEGSIGNAVAVAGHRRYAVARAPLSLDPRLARAAALGEARTFGVIGLLSSVTQGDPAAPTAPWGQDTTTGASARSSRGLLWGGERGDTWGAGGLGLSGIGEGGGGRGEGIGLGRIDVFGYGSGTGLGQGFGSGSGHGCSCGTGRSQGFGSGLGRLSGSHKTFAPKVRTGNPEIHGHLPPDLIARTIRQSFWQLRYCYEQGVARSPNLQGRVSVRFVIARDGSVTNVRDGGSDLPDRGVVSCVMRAYFGLSFPKPEDGIVTVVYPIQFEPG